MIIPFFHNWSYSSFLHSMGCALLEYHSSTHACNIGKYIFIQLAFNNWWWVENEMEINGKVKWIKRQYSWLIFTFHLGSELWINNWLHICTNIAWLLCCSSSKMNSADGCANTKIWKKIFGLLIIHMLEGLCWTNLQWFGNEKLLLIRSCIRILLLRKSVFYFPEKIWFSPNSQYLIWLFALN